MARKPLQIYRYSKGDLGVYSEEPEEGINPLNEKTSEEMTIRETIFSMLKAKQMAKLTEYFDDLKKQGYGNKRLGILSHEAMYKMGMG